MATSGGVPDDALREGGVLLQAQAPGEERMADGPDGEVVAAVEVEAGEAVELAQELVAQALGVVEDDDGHDAALVDEGHECVLDVGDDLRARARTQAEVIGLRTTIASVPRLCSKNPSSRTSAFSTPVRTSRVPWRLRAVLARPRGSCRRH